MYLQLCIWNKPYIVLLLFCLWTVATCSIIAHDKYHVLYFNNFNIICASSSSSSSFIHFLTSQHFSWFSKEYQCHWLHTYSLFCKSLLTLRHAFCIVAFCKRIYGAGRRLSSFILPCNLYRLIPGVDSTNVPRMMISVAIFLQDQVLTGLKILGDNAINVVNVMNCYLHQICFFESIVSHKYVWSVLWKRTVFMGLSKYSLRGL